MPTIEPFTYDQLHAEIKRLQALANEMLTDVERLLRFDGGPEDDKRMDDWRARIRGPIKD